VTNLRTSFRLSGLEISNIIAPKRRYSGFKSAEEDVSRNAIQLTVSEFSYLCGYFGFLYFVFVFLGCRIDLILNHILVYFVWTCCSIGTVCPI